MTTAWPVTPPLLARYHEVLRGRAADRTGIAPVEVTRHHVHLTNNRLGIPQAEEGLLARLLLTAPGMVTG